MVGHFGVGKTSMVKQFVHQKFSEKYMSTIGVKVDKKVIRIEEIDLTLLLWDIEGNGDLTGLPKSYFLGASGLIYVYDLTRPLTFVSVKESLGYLQSLVPKIKIKIAGNKADLLDAAALEAQKEKYIIPPDFYTVPRQDRMLRPFLNPFQEKCWHELICVTEHISRRKLPNLSVRYRRHFY